MKRISLALGLATTGRGGPRRGGGRAMILGDEVEAEAAPDAARLALYDAMYARQMTPAAGRTASR